MAVVTKKILLVLFCAISLISCSSTESFTKCTVELEGKGLITLKRTEEDTGVKFRIETSDPVALRTLMMQGFVLQIIGTLSDTTIADTTIITFPSARDVSKQIEHHPGEVKATFDGNKEKRPDIRPLVTALRNADVCISKTGLRMISVHDNNDVSVNPTNGVLSYSVEVPSDYMCDGYNVITLLSLPDKNMRVGTEYSAKQDIPTSSPKNIQPFGVNSDKKDDGMRKNIKIDFILDNITDGK